MGTPDTSAATPDRVRVLVVDGHPVLRGVIRMACGSTADLEVVGEAADVDGAVQACEETDPDVIVLDLDLPGGDGIDVIRRIRALSLGGRVLVLTDRTHGGAVLECLRLGVQGYVDKSTGIRTIGTAIRKIGRGERLIDPALEQAAVMELGRFAKRAREGSEAATALTPRELEILELMSGGLTMRQIATRLGISPRTVETHAAKLYRKLAVRTRVQAVARAASLGLIELN
jgi:DNA-binding NarL/FixJ family response regulator